MQKWTCEEERLLEESINEWGAKAYNFFPYQDEDYDHLKASLEWVKITKLHNKKTKGNRSKDSCRHKYHDMRSEILLEGFSEVSDYEWKLGLKKLKGIEGQAGVNRIKRIVRNFK